MSEGVGRLRTVRLKHYGRMRSRALHRALAIYRADLVGVLAQKADLMLAKIPTAMAMHEPGRRPSELSRAPASGALRRPPSRGRPAVTLVVDTCVGPDF